MTSPATLTHDLNHDLVQGPIRADCTPGGVA